MNDEENVDERGALVLSRKRRGATVKGFGGGLVEELLSSARVPVMMGG